MSATILEEHKLVHCFTSSIVAACEDMWNGDPASDVISMAGWRLCIFNITKNAGAVGTATITVESCDDVTPTTATAVAFRYRTSTSVDTWSDWTAATATGFTTTAGADQQYQVAIYADELYTDTTTKAKNAFVRMQITEVDSTAVDGNMEAMLFLPRQKVSVATTVLA